MVIIVANDEKYNNIFLVALYSCYRITEKYRYIHKNGQIRLNKVYIAVGDLHDFYHNKQKLHFIHNFNTIWTSIGAVSILIYWSVASFHSL